MTDHAARIGEAITLAARAMHHPRTVPETLEAIVRATLDTVPGFDHVGISITRRDGSIETLAGTDPLVWELDDLQYKLREGPCFDSITQEKTTAVEHARHDQRWPRYMPGAASMGLRAQLALGLFNDDHSLGGLNLYSTESDTIEPDAVHIAELFATHATLALGRSRTESELTDAVETRQVIGQATGIVMERYRIDEHRAFQFLVRASQTGNIKLRDVARELVRSVNEEHSRQE